METTEAPAWSASVEVQLGPGGSRVGELRPAGR